MLDNASAHFSVQAREYLDINHNDGWLGRGGTQMWPPRTPDMKSLDYFSWEH